MLGGRYVVLESDLLDFLTKTRVTASCETVSQPTPNHRRAVALLHEHNMLAASKKEEKE